MKTVKLAGIVLAVAVVLVLCSALYVRSTVSDLLSLTGSLSGTPSPETAAGAEAVMQLLDKAEPVLSLVVARPFIDEARSLALSLQVRATMHDAVGCAEAHAQLTEAVRELARLERVDIRNIM